MKDPRIPICVDEPGAIRAAAGKKKTKALISESRSVSVRRPLAMCISGQGGDDAATAVWKRSRIVKRQ